jgi:WhiB family transcriptional regulator, redox-sensing transcriptional regulator
MDVMHMQEQKLMWRQQAACRDYDTDIFFPDSDAAAGPALEVCASCPVRDACLEFALTTNQPDGIWGGATETERRRMRRRRRQAA